MFYCMCINVTLVLLLLSPAKIFHGGILFWYCPSVLSLSVYPSTCPSRFSVRTHILVMDFQILLTPAEDFEGDIVLPLSVRPASFRPSGQLWTTES